jgi:hypothetical protein
MIEKAKAEKVTSFIVIPSLVCMLRFITLIPVFNTLMIQIRWQRHRKMEPAIRNSTEFCSSQHRREEGANIGSKSGNDTWLKRSLPPADSDRRMFPSSPACIFQI